MPALTQQEAAELIAKPTINDQYHRDYINPKPSAMRVNDIGELYDRQTTVAFITMTACITAIIASVVIMGRR
jgi:hypothetical protein